MRIAVFSRAIPAHGVGGMEQVAWSLMHEWVKSGHEVTCFTTPFSQPCTTPEGLTVCVLDGRSGTYSRRWFTETVEAFEHGAFDVGLGVSAGAHAIALSEHKNIFMQAHGTSMDEIRTKLRVRSARSIVSIPKNFKGLAIDLRVYPKFAAVIAVGAAVESSLRKMPKFGAPRRVIRIENGVEPRGRIGPETRHETRKRLGVAGGEPLAVCAGRLHREKGVDIAIDALSYWPGHLVVVGDGPAGQELKERVARARCGSRVTFTGRLDRHEVLEVVGTADVMVMPSRRIEGLPIAALESLSVGTPVLTSEAVVSAMGGLTEHSVVGAELNPATFAQEMNKIVKSSRSESVQLPEVLRLHTSANRYVEVFERYAS